MNDKKIRKANGTPLPHIPQKERFMIGKPICHFAPGAPATTHMIPKITLPMMTMTILCQTFKPREIKDDPVVQPEMLKDPVTTQRPTNCHGPYVRRDGGKGLVSRVTYPFELMSSSRGTSSGLSRCCNLENAMFAAIVDNKADHKTLDKGATTVMKQVILGRNR
jgi:hypothetical protein